MNKKSFALLTWISYFVKMQVFSQIPQNYSKVQGRLIISAVFSIVHILSLKSWSPVTICKESGGVLWGGGVLWLRKQSALHFNQKIHGSSSPHIEVSLLWVVSKPRKMPCKSTSFNKVEENRRGIKSCMSQTARFYSWCHSCSVATRSAYLKIFSLALVPTVWGI